MPFYGVLPERLHLFQPQPNANVGVNDREAWRLNPKYRSIYNKLELAMWQGLKAAPCSISPTDFGLTLDQKVFVKPIINLDGMSLNARSLAVSEVDDQEGSFWCEHLEGQQTSSDCLVQNGKAIWFAHTLASAEKSKHRPIYWEIGVDLRQNENLINKLLQAYLADYTGLINVEVINGFIIEVHLRGSNAFFDFYGDSFVSAWVKMVDQKTSEPPPEITGGVVYSIFTERKTPETLFENWRFSDVSVQIDTKTQDRLCILRGKNLSRVRHVATWIEDHIE